MNVSQRAIKNYHVASYVNVYFATLNGHLEHRRIIRGVFRNATFVTHPWQRKTGAAFCERKTRCAAHSA